jgi:hypothetical protein
MQPPNVLVQPIYSGWNLITANNIGTWGEVVQINPNTLPFNVGNIVFYNPQDVPLIYSQYTNQFYNVLNEDRILFIESGVPLPP